MRTKLPRQMIWTDKTTLDEFLEDPLGSKLYDLYRDMLRSSYSSFLYKIQPLKLFNEAFYQSIRIVFEKNPHATIREYSDEIKANIGQKNASEAVLHFVLYILLVQEDQTREIIRITDLLRNRFRTPLEIDVVDSVVDVIKAGIQGKSVRLSPNPSPVEYINNMVVDWHKITEGYSKNAIENLLTLWQSRTERFKLMKIIEKEFCQYIPSLFEMRPQDVVDMKYFNSYYENNEDLLGNSNEPMKPSYEELELKLAMAEKANLAMKTEIEHLKSELNMTKKKDHQVRSFTLSLIVDYCKNKIHISQVESIIAMLYKLLRMSGTEEDYALVDSIEEDFSKRKGGQTVEHQTVERQIVIPKDGHYHEHTDTVNNQFPAMPPMVGQRKIIE